MARGPRFPSNSQPVGPTTDIPFPEEICAGTSQIKLASGVSSNISATRVELNRHRIPAYQ